MCHYLCEPQFLWYVAPFAIQQKEIDTHLNVLHVAVNSNYASFTDTKTALDRMTAIYGAGRTSFHFPKADLHHAVLGRAMGGGRAYLGALCSPTRGFGLSTEMQGNYSQMSSAVVWDFSVVSMCSFCRTYIVVCALLRSSFLFLALLLLSFSSCMKSGTTSVLIILMTLAATRLLLITVEIPALPRFHWQGVLPLCHIVTFVRKFTTH